MAEKWERLVDALGHADGWTTASELADRLGVTTRTIRNYAAQANSGGVIVESGPAGYRLDRAAWANRGTPARRDSSPAVRAARVIRSLIDATDGLDVHETAAANHVSDSTFEADLARVRNSDTSGKAARSASSSSMPRADSSRNSAPSRRRLAVSGPSSVMRGPCRTSVSPVPSRLSLIHI